MTEAAYRVIRYAHELQRSDPTKYRGLEHPLSRPLLATANQILQHTQDGASSPLIEALGVRLEHQRAQLKTALDQEDAKRKTTTKPNTGSALEILKPNQKRKSNPRRKAPGKRTVPAQRELDWGGTNLPGRLK
jgi:hypothetical protein